MRHERDIDTVRPARPGGRGRRLAVAAGAVAALAACGSASAAPQVHRGQVQALRAGALTTADVAQAQTAFGLDLLHTVCGQGAGRNVLVSPTSAAEALSLLYPAADGPTAAALAGLLRLPAWSPELVAALHAHSHALDALRYSGDLTKPDAPDSLQMSNHLWTAPSGTPTGAYLDDIATAFGADVHVLDFEADPGAATDRINRSVDEDTRGMIHRLFDQPLDRSTTAVLTDALHLKARWATPFTGTAPAPFAAPTGSTTVAMMSGGAGTLRGTGGWQSVELPYRDGTLAAVVVLPPPGSDPCSADAARLAALAAAPTSQVDVRFPRMTLEQTHELSGPLAAMGLPLDGAYPGLGVGGTISQVAQKVVLTVDEQGTEAAAATGVAIAVSGRVAQPVVTVDRPFLLLLTDSATRSPVVAAVVDDPSA